MRAGPYRNSEYCLALGSMFEFVSVFTYLLKGELYNVHSDLVVQ